MYGVTRDPESVAICLERFGARVAVSHAALETFDYPCAGIVIANVRLFFATPDECDATWQKTVACLELGGVFCHSLTTSIW